jgi:hypothetical protein
LSEESCCVKRPAGASHASMDPLRRGKVARALRFLSPVYCWVNRRDTAPCGVRQVPKCYCRERYRWRRLAVGRARTSGAEVIGFIMRDLLFLLLYLAMVATPAVVAVRSGREAGPEE